jgi:hypothetical protein
MVNRGLKPINSINPKTVSKMTTNKAMAKEYGTKKGKFKTVSPKYSPSL